MEIQTKACGKRAVDKEDIITIPQGLYGFEDETEFVLIDSEYKPFIWLQSIRSQSLAFLLIDPFLFWNDYELDVDDENLHKIGVYSPADVLVYAIVTIPADKTPVTVNLQGPLILNKANNQAIQLIAADPRWQTKHDLVSQIKKQPD